MSVVAVTRTAPRLNIIKAFAIRLGNTRAAATATSLMRKDAVQRTASRTKGWAKSPTGLAVIGALLSDERVLKWVINKAGSAIRAAGDAVKWAVSRPVAALDTTVEVATGLIAKVSERLAVGFDTVAKLPVRAAYGVINAVSSFTSRVFRRVEHSANNPSLIATTAQAAFVVSMMQFLSHFPVVSRLGAPTVRALCRMPLFGNLFRKASSSGWTPLVMIGTVFLFGLIVNMFWNYSSHSILLSKEASASQAAPAEAEQPAEETDVHPDQGELLYVTVDGTAFSEEEAIALSRRVIAHNRNKGPASKRKK